jgi:hypothetical protein
MWTDLCHSVSVRFTHAGRKRSMITAAVKLVKHLYLPLAVCKMKRNSSNSKDRTLALIVSR